MRFLFASPHSLLDVSSGAAIGMQTLLQGLLQAGHQAIALGATVYDSQDAKRNAPGPPVTHNPLQFFTVQKGRVKHLLLPTRGWRRALMTAIEEDALVRHYRSLLDQAPPDVVITYGGMLLERNILAEAKRRGILTVFDLVNPSYHDGHAFEHVDCFITDTHATAKLYHQRLGLTLHPLGALVDSQAFLATHRAPRYCTFINPSPEKGVGMVARLALMCRGLLPQVEFLIVESRGRWEPSLKKIGLNETLLPNVTVWPEQTDMRKVYAQTRILLAPSFWHESGGRVALEAMINGIPVLASSHGGFAELLSGGGMLLDIPHTLQENFTTLPTEADAKPWFDALFKLCTDSLHYAIAGAKARDAARKYDLQSNINKFIDLVRPEAPRQAREGTASNTPAISVIFPVANREAYLHEAVASILAQTFENFELLIIEDGVAPAVQAILDAFDDLRIRRIRLPLPMGVSTARNAGLAAARAPLIALMDSDDVALPQRLQTQFDWMQAHPDVTVCGSNAIKIIPDGRRLAMRYPESDAKIKARFLIVDSAIINPTAMFRGDFIRLHRIRYDPNFPRDQDHRFFVELLRHGADFFGIQESLLLYRRHHKNNTNDEWGFDKLKTGIRQLLIADFYPGLTSEQSRNLLLAFNRHLDMTAKQCDSCLAALELAAQERRSTFGEDREELNRIIDSAKRRLIKYIATQ